MDSYLLERNAAAKKLDQVALCHSENALTFRDYLATSAYEVIFFICQVFCRNASNIAEKLSLKYVRIESNPAAA